VADVMIRELDDAVLAALRAMAELRGKTLEEDLREIIHAAARPQSEARLALVDRIRGMTPRVPQSDSTALVREDRNR